MTIKFTVQNKYSALTVTPVDNGELVEKEQVVVDVGGALTFESGPGRSFLIAEVAAAEAEPEPTGKKGKK